MIPMPDNPPVLQLDAVSKSFAGKVAVNSLSLRVRPGELYAFLGPNGAGKTTTLKIAVGLLRPDKGSALILGRPVQSYVGAAAPVPFSFVPEEPHLYDRLTAREFFHFVGETSGLSRDTIKARIDEYAGRLGVFDFIDDTAVTYSHGMRQRVAVAAALLTNPALLVVDEPMVGLDPNAARSLKQILRELTSQNKSVLLSTHTLAIAEEIADRIGIMNLGRIVAEGPPASLTRPGETLEQAFSRLTSA